MTENVENVKTSGGVSELESQGATGINMESRAEMLSKMGVDAAMMERVNKAIGDLISSSLKLALKVARCQCDKKDKCMVYRAAQKVVEAVDAVQDLTE